MKAAGATTPAMGEMRQVGSGTVQVAVTVVGRYWWFHKGEGMSLETAMSRYLWNGPFRSQKEARRFSHLN